MNPNRKAFLDMIAFSEGVRAGQHPLTQFDGYDVIVTGIDGPEVFRLFDSHPFSPDYPGNSGIKRASRQINRSGLTSNASGRYQFMLKDWPHYREGLSLPDFGPDSQDRWALQLIRERGALPLIDGGSFADAVQRCSNLWASLPGAGYGQHENGLTKLQVAYVEAGGTLA